MASGSSSSSLISRWQLEAALQRVAPFSRPRRDLEQYTTPAEVAASVLLDVHSRWGGECFAAGRSVLDLGCGPGALLIGCLALGAGYVCGVDLDAAALADCRRNLAEFYGQEGPSDEEDEAPPDGRCDLLQADICAIARSPASQWLDRLRGRFDAVVTNPPFGTYSSAAVGGGSARKKLKAKTNRKASSSSSASEATSKGADLAFLELGIAVTRRLVVSLHKTSTMEHVMERARDACVRRLQLADGSSDGDQASLATAAQEGRDYSVRQVARLRYNLDRSYRHHREESRDIDVGVLEVAILR